MSVPLGSRKERLTGVLVFAAVPWPDHTNLPSDQRYVDDNVRKGKPSLAFRRKLLLGKPCEPSHVWTCGTDVVWPVLELDGVPVARVFVCRHQIVAGD